jgi:hypothetical protein
VPHIHTLSFDQNSILVNSQNRVRWLESPPPREVFPDTGGQCCWFRKQANVLAALRKSAHSNRAGAQTERVSSSETVKTVSSHFRTARQRSVGRSPGTWDTRRVDING